MINDLERLTLLYEEHRNEENAGPMKKYMKDHFPFLGMKSPLRKELEKEFFKETEILKKPFNQEFVEELWEKDEREYQYTAITYMGKFVKKLPKDSIAFIEQLITTKSWWDSVDSIVPLVGELARRYPEVIEETINSWAVDDNVWLRRTAILFQLKFKQQTNEELLYEYITKNAGSKEFFIEKAIGWALREYSKTNPVSVKKFIEGHVLASLSVREGSKYLS
ncbi:DNA alkylation repair protein [Neobacillus niacini]|uniref:DNA alkylation repair protein n=1 Tax=Neobacillus niacini TaxID=86668 RepID=UPI0007ABFEDE|nr:DNA alkylation repair protein [Neobacillus niacini]MEC1521977.1 DNA alkylation repair protein [Neobacillus niacini]